jgi:hypothetical protein
MRLYILQICIYVCFAQWCLGQKTRPSNQVMVAWDAALPVNPDFLTKFSLAGWRIEYRHFIKSNISVGIGISRNYFSQYFESQQYTTKDESMTMTTDMQREIVTVPITINGYYHFATSVDTKPYVGIGLGAQYSDQSAYFNIYSLREKNWGFVARPEIGITLSGEERLGSYFSLAYNYATNQNADFRINSLQHLSGAVGIFLNMGSRRRK